VSNSAHSVQFTLCALWSRSYTKYLQLRIFRLQYSAEGRSPAIGGISTIQCALYCKRGSKCSAHRPVYAVWTVVPVIYNEFTAPHIRLQYSTVGICAAIVDITTIECALYCKLGAKYSAHPSVYARELLSRPYAMIL
jgi:hypothetical protein